MADESVLRIVFLWAPVFLLGVVVGACKPSGSAVEVNRPPCEPNKGAEQIVLGNEMSNPSSPAILDIIRTLATDESPSLSEQEMTLILQSPPDVGRYRIGIGVYEYSWAWRLPTGRVVLVSYTGDLGSMTPDKVRVYLHDL